MGHHTASTKRSDSALAFALRPHASIVAFRSEEGTRSWSERQLRRRHSVTPVSSIHNCLSRSAKPTFGIAPSVTIYSQPRIQHSLFDILYP